MLLHRRTQGDNGEVISALPAFTAFVKASSTDWSEWLLTELEVLPLFALVIFLPYLLRLLLASSLPCLSPSFAHL